jgi:hypothetical protein
VDFFDPRALAEKVAEVLKAPDRFDAQRERGRRSVVERCSLDRCVPRQVAIARAVCNGETLSAAI